MAGERAFFSWCSCLTFVCFELLGRVIWTSLYGALDSLYGLDFLYSALDFCKVFLDMNFSV